MNSLRYGLLLFVMASLVQARLVSVEQLRLEEPSFVSLREYVSTHAGPFVLKFFSPTCPPCSAMKPIFDEFIRFYGDGLVGIQINVMANSRDRQEFGVNRWPTFVFFINGKEAGRFSGKVPLSELKRLAKAYFGL